MWPRCATVELRDGALYCELALNRQYDLIDAYRSDPHIQFLNCKSPEDLRLFTRAWGPLYLVCTRGAEEIVHGTAIRRLDETHAHQRWLHAIKGMIDACKGVADQRVALVEFLGAESDMDRTSNTYQPGSAPLFHQILQQRFQLEDDLAGWVASADLSSVQRALAFTVEMKLQGPRGGLRVDQKGRRIEIKPRFAVGTLWDALQWMLWLDEWNRRLPLSCLECHRIFRPLTAHEMKYCTHQCAHRASNREWRRKNLREQKIKRKTKTRGGTNGPRKTR